MEFVGSGNLSKASSGLNHCVFIISSLQEKLGSRERTLPICFSLLQPLPPPRSQSPTATLPTPNPTPHPHPPSRPQLPTARIPHSPPPHPRPPPPPHSTQSQPGSLRTGSLASSLSALLIILLTHTGVFLPRDLPVYFYPPLYNGIGAVTQGSSRL